MKYCAECKVNVRGNFQKCPLCASALSGEAFQEAQAYPQPNILKSRYSLVKRILLFVSVLASLICLVINYFNPEPMWWSLIVITSLIYAWVIIPHSLRRGGNFAGKIFTQVMCGIALIILLDFEIGWQAWSVNYVVPVMLCTGIVAVGMVIVFNSTSWSQYVIYQILLALFGFAPLVLNLIGVSHNIIFALITLCFALTALLATIIFGDKSIKNEFKRRFRF